MKVTAKAGREDIAVVYIADMGRGRMVEFVESLEPPIPRSRKWVIIISTLYGCPVECRICDAGRSYRGKLTARDMISQIDYIVRRRYPDGRVPVEKFKVQFARMGEPAFNRSVLEVLERLPTLYDAPGLIPAVSTIAPEGSGDFFDRLADIRRRLYPRRFQLQFSIHTTDEELRNWLMPTSKWSLARIAQYGDGFYEEGGRKITLNFALAEGVPVDADVLLDHFSPERFAVKVTPVNPTLQAMLNGIVSTRIDPVNECGTVKALGEAGYDVIVSVGEPEENSIGSNCGQYISGYIEAGCTVEGSYTYRLVRGSGSDEAGRPDSLPAKQRPPG